jgi:ribosomal protein S18 acetylase RimI-like enzyme
MIVLRQATAADLPTVSALAERIWPVTYSEYLSEQQLRYMLDQMYSQHELLSQMQQGYIFLMAAVDGADVGFAAFSLTDPAHQYYKLHKIYVLTSVRGKGVGKLLMNKVIDTVKRNGGKVLQLNVNRNNKAQDFYEKAGFKIKETVDINIGNGFFMNDYVMEKEL